MNTSRIKELQHEHQDDEEYNSCEQEHSCQFQLSYFLLNDQGEDQNREYKYAEPLSSNSICSMFFYPIYLQEKWSEKISKNDEIRHWEESEDNYL